MDPICMSTNVPMRLSCTYWSLFGGCEYRSSLAGRITASSGSHRLTRAPQWGRIAESWTARRTEAQCRISGWRTHFESGGQDMCETSPILGQRQDGCLAPHAHEAKQSWLLACMLRRKPSFVGANSCSPHTILSSASGSSESVTNRLHFQVEGFFA